MLTTETSTTKYEFTDLVASELVLGSTFQRSLNIAMGAPFTRSIFAKHDRFKKEFTFGVWFFTEPGKNSDITHTLAVYWPFFLERMRRRVYGPGSREEELMARAALQATLREGVQSSQAVIQSLEYALLRVLPAGVLVQPTNELRAVLFEKLKPEFPRGVEECLKVMTFLRFPTLIASPGKNLRRIVHDLQPVNGRTLTAMPAELLMHCPIVVRLLYHALQRARFDTPGAGWVKWGLLWTPNHLIFNQRVAATNLMALDEEAELFDNADVEWLLQQLPTVMGGRFLYRRRNLPPLSRYAPTLRTLLPVHRQNILALDYHFDLPEWAGTSRPSMDAEDYTVFPLKQKDSLIKFFSVIQNPEYMEQELFHHTNLTPPPTRARNVAARKEEEAAEKPEREDGYEEPLSITVNAVSLGFTYEPEMDAPYDPKYVPMTVYHAQWGLRHYISLPVEFGTHFPKAVAGRYPWAGLLQNRGKARVSAGVLYLDVDHLSANHTAATDPLVMIRAWLESERSAQPEDRAFFNCFARLCSWLHDPMNSEHLGFYVSTWFEYACTEDPRGRVAPYPKPFNTLEKRIEFLRAKGKCAKKHDVRGLETLSTQDRKARRSGKRAEYDDFVFWYIANVDLRDYAARKFRFVHQEYAKYVTYRWMRWRRIEGNIKYLVVPPLWGRIPTAWEAKEYDKKHGRPGFDSSVPKCYPAQNILNSPSTFADEPVTFPHEEPRSGPMVSRYIYEEDVAK